jgi:hypothetical protein
MLKSGTKLCAKETSYDKNHYNHVIDDIKITKDGLLLYRAAPYQVYLTEHQIVDRFDFVDEFSNQKNWLLRIFLWIKGTWHDASVFMETPVTKPR